MSNLKPIQYDPSGNIVDMMAAVINGDLDAAQDQLQKIADFRGPGYRNLQAAKKKAGVYPPMQALTDKEAASVASEIARFGMKPQPELPKKQGEVLELDRKPRSRKKGKPRG